MICIEWAGGGGVYPAGPHPCQAHLRRLQIQARLQKQHLH